MWLEDRTHGFTMMLHWLVYISMNLIALNRLEREIAEIVEDSCVRNAARGITGALIATPTHLAQYMEGPGDVVADLLDRIGRDDRHANLRVIDRGTRADRLFPDWHMGYIGESVFVRRRVAELFEVASRRELTPADRLVDLMREFARPPP